MGNITLAEQSCVQPKIGMLYFERKKDGIILGTQSPASSITFTALLFNEFIGISKSLIQYLQPNSLVLYGFIAFLPNEDPWYTSLNYISPILSKMYLSYFLHYLLIIVVFSYFRLTILDKNHTTLPLGVDSPVFSNPVGAIKFKFQANLLNCKPFNSKLFIFLMFIAQLSGSELT